MVGGREDFSKRGRGVCHKQCRIILNQELRKLIFSGISFAKFLASKIFGKKSGDLYYEDHSFDL